MHPFFDSAPLVAYGLEGHPNAPAVYSILGEARPTTIDSAIARAYEDILEIGTRQRNATVKFAGAIFAMRLFETASLTSADIDRVVKALPPTTLGQRLSKTLAMRVHPGETGGTLQAWVNDAINDAPLINATMYWQVVKLRVDVLPSSSYGDPALSAELDGYLEEDARRVVVAAHCLGKNGRNVTIVTGNPVLLASKSRIRETTKVADVKTVRDYVDAHVKGEK